MKTIIGKISNFFSNRETVLISVTVLIGIIYIITLFNLQIINGEEYRDSSQNKMLRTESITSARGEILDTNGVVLATNKISWDLSLYNVDVTSKEQNDAILEVINILEDNGDSITSRFPVNDELDDFNFTSDSEELSWKEDLEFEENATFDEIIDIYIYRYGLEDYDITDAKKIIQVRYEAGILGYSLFTGVTVASDISEKSVAQIEEMSFKLYGFKVEETLERYYPYGELFAHSIGYVSSISSEEYADLKDEGYTLNSSIGKTGIEYSFEEYLKGEDGIVKTEVNTSGEISSETITQRPVAGDSITLTLDYRLQQVALDSLVEVIEDINEGNNGYDQNEEAASGAVVVMDTETGEILAMVSYPSFDPNEFVGGISYDYWSELLSNSLNPMTNRVISGTYAPGSTYKMMMGVAALEEGAITIDEEILDTGIYSGGHNPSCWIYDDYGLTHGYLTVSEAIQVSCNVFFYELGSRLGITTMNEYSRLFGLGEKTGIEIPGEVEGTVAGDDIDITTWYLGQTLSAAIGQESNSFTPISMVNYIAALANEGILNRVKLVKSIVDNDNTSISSDEINTYIEEYTGVSMEETDLEISEENLEAVTYGMLLVTSSGGTSYSVFKDLDVEVAGKTGTAQVTNGISNGIFVGYAPYDDPKIAVYAVIEGAGSGTYVANVVKPIFEEYFEIENSDKLNENNQNTVESDIEF